MNNQETIMTNVIDDDNVINDDAEIIDDDCNVDNTSDDAEIIDDNIDIDIIDDDVDIINDDDADIIDDDIIDDVDYTEENTLSECSSELIANDDIFDDISFDDVISEIVILDVEEGNGKSSYQKFLKIIGKLSESNRAKFISCLQSYCKQKRRSHVKLQQNELFNICSAKTSIGTICNRKCSNIVARFCPTHINNPTKYDHVERRSRPEKAIVSLEEIDMNNYFPTKIQEFEGQTVLVDENGFIYDKRDFTILARRLESGEVVHLGDTIQGGQVDSTPPGAAGPFVLGSAVQHNT